MTPAVTSIGGRLSWASNAVPAVPFCWRDSSGCFHAPKTMETRHLFYTLRMIWNHSMPEQLRIEPFRRYRFGSFYTPEYMKQAVRQIGEELLKRCDLEPIWRVQLELMACHFRGSAVMIDGQDAA